jgi:hypothetical protein
MKTRKDKLNEAHQLLVCADYATLPGKNININKFNGRHHDVLAKYTEELRSLYTSSTTKFYYIRGYMFRPYK